MRLLNFLSMFDAPHFVCTDQNTAYKIEIKTTIFNLKMPNDKNVSLPKMNYYKFCYTLFSLIEFYNVDVCNEAIVGWSKFIMLNYNILKTFSKKQGYGFFKDAANLSGDKFIQMWMFIIKELLDNLEDDDTYNKLNFVLKQCIYI